MAPDKDLQKRGGRKLTKRRKPARASSVQYPERLREGDDAHEDVTAATGKPAQYVNQSVFSMIAAAGSKTDFHARFEGEGSDSEDDQEVPAISHTIEEKLPETPLEESLEREEEDVTAMAHLGRQQGKLAECKGLHSLPKLKVETGKEKDYMSQSLLLPPKEGSSSHATSVKGVTPRDAPLMSKILEAQAELSSSAQPPEMTEDFPRDMEGIGGGATPVSLATRLMEIFGFEEPEEVISGVQIQEIAAVCLSANKPQSILAGFYKVFYSKAICTLPKDTSVSLDIYQRNL